MLTRSSVLDIPCDVLLKFEKETAPAKNFSQAASNTTRRHRRLAQDNRVWHTYFVVSAGPGEKHHRRSSTRHASLFFAGQQRTSILIFPQTTAGAILQWTAKALDQIDHIDLPGTLTPWTEVQAFNHVLCLCVCALLMLVSKFVCLATKSTFILSPTTTRFFLWSLHCACCLENVHFSGCSPPTNPFPLSACSISPGRWK